MKILNTTDPTALHQSLTEFLSESRSIYGGMLDKVPESLRPEVERLKKLLDDKLAALNAQPTGQFSAANAAANSLEHLASTLAWMQEMYVGVTKGLQELMSQISPKEQALHSLNERIAQGELVEKATAEASTNKAVTDAIAAERAAVLRLTTRRQALSSANLPVPGDDCALGGDDAAFRARVEKAKERQEKLKALGTLQQLSGSDVEELLYGPDKDFERFSKIAGQARQTAEPLAGTPSLKKLIGF